MLEERRIERKDQGAGQLFMGSTALVSMMKPRLVLSSLTGLGLKGAI